ncbi:helix-turn-helix domain-containing protein [Streptomyces sp. NPDC047928]|uniref:helix-turn-helix domain-containing protein n=1 Tax=unclassified Streptomyces TaxID=2593676 RepID=UPI0037132C87
MAARKPPTERQRRLGVELRRMRERAGLPLAEAAALHGVDKTTISNTESARFGVSPDRVRVWASNYACSDAPYVDALAAMARERPGGNWWDECRDAVAPAMLDLAELEHHATALRHVQITHLPGLLQHPDYARASFLEALPPLKDEEIEQRIAFRVRRQGILDRPEAPECSFLVHEAALRMHFGGRAVIRTQLAHMLKQADREQVTIRVIPFEAGGFTSVAGSTLYACGPVAMLDTVQIDVSNGMTFLYAETDLVNYRVLLARMQDRSLDPDRSRDFIREVLQEL